MKITTVLLTFSLLAGTSIAISQNENIVQPQQQQQTESISDQELTQFAHAYQKVQIESQKMQEEAVKTIKDEGMDVERFNQISTAQQNPQAEVEVAEEEEAKIKVINPKIEKIQADFQNNVSAAIEKEGLTVERFQNIMQEIQQDPSLQERFGKLMNS